MTSVVGAGYFVLLQLAQGDDSVNLIVDLVMFYFVAIYLIEMKGKLS